jgi:MFS family permease
MRNDTKVGLRTTGPLLAVIAADSVSSGLVLPVLPFLGKDLGDSSLLVGVLFSAYGVAQFCAAPFWGALADRMPVRPLICAAAGATALGHLVFGLATSYPELLAGRVAAGLGGGTVLMAQTYIAATSTADNRTVRLGRITAVQGIGTIAGPVLGAGLITYGHLWIGVVAAGMSLLTGLSALALPQRRAAGGKRSGPSWTALRAVGRTHEVWALAGLVLLGWLSFAGYATVLPLALRARLHMSTHDYQAIMAISGVTALIVRGALIGRITKRFGDRGSTALGGALIALSMLLVPVLASAALTPLLPLLYAAGASIMFPCLMSQLAAAAPAEVTGSVMAGSSMLAGIGRIAGPVLLGALAGAGGSALPFLTGAVLLLLGVALVMRIRIPQTDPSLPEAAL